MRIGMGGSPNTLGLLANFKITDGDLQGAQAAYQEQSDIARMFKDKNRTNPYWHRMFVTSQLNIGDLYFLGENDFESAGTFYSEALDAARELSTLNPSIALWQTDLVLALWRHAQLKQRQSNSAKAMELSLEALAIVERLDHNNELVGQAKQSPDMLRNEFKISTLARK